MDSYDMIVTLNPVPLPQGNPGPVSVRHERPCDQANERRSTYVAAALAVAACLLAAIVVAQTVADEPIQLEVATQPAQPPVPAQPGDLVAAQQPAPDDPAPDDPAPEEQDRPLPLIKTTDEIQGLARLVILSIDVDVVVGEGIDTADLRLGPGHVPGSAFPGQHGTAVVVGHRTTYGAPFHRIDELEAGDAMYVTTIQGTFEYIVSGTEIVDADDFELSAGAAGDGANLQLVANHPLYTDRQRIVVSATLIGKPVPTMQLPIAGQDPWLPSATPPRCPERRAPCSASCR